MTIVGMTEAANILKTLYKEDKIEELTYPGSAFYARVRKSYDFEGASRAIRVRHAPLRGSSTFASALANKGAPGYSEFLVTRTKDYVLGEIDCETMMATRSQKGATVDVLKDSIKAASEEFGKSMGRKIWGSGGGAICQAAASSAVSTTRLRLANKEDIIHFEVGMLVQTASTNGTTGAVNPGEAAITRIDAINGDLYTGSNWATQIPAIADADYLFRSGDFGSSFAGIFAWIPVSAPTSGVLFYGVDRAINEAKLAGQRYSGSGGSVLEVAIDAAARAGHYGGKPDTLWLGSFKFAEFAKECLAKGQMPIPVKDARGNLSLSSFSIPGPKGDISVMQDTYCPDAYGLLTDMSCWELAALGQIPQLDEEEGKVLTRSANADSREFRNKFYGNQVCHRPQDNVMITW